MSHFLADCLRTWQRKCGRNWAILISIVTGTAAIIGLYQLAGPVLAEMRPWSTRHETGVIALRVYPRALADQQLKTISLENRLRWLEERSVKGELTPEQWAEIPIIRDLIRESREDEAQIIKEKAFFELTRGLK